MGVAPPGARMSSESGVFNSPGAVPATLGWPCCHTSRASAGVDGYDPIVVIVVQHEHA